MIRGGSDDQKWLVSRLFRYNRGVGWNATLLRHHENVFRLAISRLSCTTLRRLYRRLKTIQTTQEKLVCSLRLPKEIGMTEKKKKNTGDIYDKYSHLNGSNLDMTIKLEY